MHASGRRHGAHREVADQRADPGAAPDPGRGSGRRRRTAHRGGHRARGGASPGRIRRGRERRRPPHHGPHRLRRVLPARRDGGPRLRDGSQPWRPRRRSARSCGCRRRRPPCRRLGRDQGHLAGGRDRGHRGGGPGGRRPRPSRPRRRHAGVPGRRRDHDGRRRRHPLSARRTRRGCRRRRRPAGRARDADRPRTSVSSWARPRARQGRHDVAPGGGRRRNPG